MKAEGLKLELYDISNVTDMQAMFSYLSGEKLDLTGLDTETRVTVVRETTVMQEIKTAARALKLIALI